MRQLIGSTGVCVYIEQPFSEVGGPFFRVPLNVEMAGVKVCVDTALRGGFYIVHQEVEIWSVSDAAWGERKNPEVFTDAGVFMVVLY